MVMAITSKELEAEDLLAISLRTPFQKEVFSPCRSHKIPLPFRVTSFAL
jgi:hypothetical protein